jgi:hypothetical protein
VIGLDEKSYRRWLIAGSRIPAISRSIDDKGSREESITTMAATDNEVKDLKSWQDAFGCPVATTRRIEQQLRLDIAANKERLRTLVG